MSNIVTSDAYAWKRIEKDLADYLNGGADVELQHLGVLAVYCDLPKDTIRQFWAEVRAERARRQGLAS